MGNTALHRVAQPRWTLTFAPADSDPDVTVRVRHLLKFALRSLGLRCIDVKEQAEPQEVVTGPIENIGDK